MPPTRDTRIVYSTDVGSVCPGCGWPRRTCQCSGRAAATEPVPEHPVAKLRMEKKGRGGKTVTVVRGLAGDDATLHKVGRQLRTACGSGGTVKDGAIEVQGDHCDRVMELLKGQGHTVKRAGG